MAKLSRERRGGRGGAVLAVVVAAVAAGVALFAAALAVFDPFATESVDRSGPTVVERIRELEQFTAAEGSFVQDVDIESDARFLPDFLKGERVVIIVSGQVRATVDFSGLDDSAVAVTEDEDGRSIALTLPQPVLQDADIDEEGTRVISRQRGLIDRIGDALASDPFDDAELYAAAEDKIQAAAADTDLEATARDNTEQWLETFLGAAGFDEVTVSWESSPE
jgi:hypothetical protein